jgi:hypothetical protein
MPVPLEYHIPVKSPAQRSIPASFALLGLSLLPLLLLSSAEAQISSVSTHAAAPSVSHGSSTTGAARPTHPIANPSHMNPHPQPHPANSNIYYYPYLYAVPVPYAANIEDSGAAADDDPDYQGGPTVFDRRGAGPYSYIPPGAESPLDSPDPKQQEDDATASYANSEPPSEPTILVFKDGHQLEIANYAIVNHTLYDLTPGHPRRIALADLDVPSTEKQNDDRGVTFQLPSTVKAD